MKKKIRKSIILFIMSFAVFIGNAMTGMAEEELRENSWRYRDGKLINSSEGISSFLLNYDAWSKTEDGFVNNEGEIIENAVKKGVDVSHHQDIIDWEKVKNTDVDFAIIRCGYSIDKENYDDRQWKRNADECTRLGIPFGVYLYSYAETVEEAKSEAQHVLRLVKGYNLEYPIYFDMEDESLLVGGKETLVEKAKAFCEIIEANGYEVGVYANKYWWNTYLKESIYETWDKWVAQYNSKIDYEGSYRIWQCTSTGKVDGIKGDVDINFELGDWRLCPLKTNVKSPQFVQQEIVLNTGIIGEKEGLQYKYSVQNKETGEWGVIRDYCSDAQATWTPEKGGEYLLRVEVKDIQGNIKSEDKDYKIAKWQHCGLTFSKKLPWVKEKEIVVSAKAAGETEGLEYKFVWQKNNWKEWGILQEFSEISDVVWAPEESGVYTLYVDIRDKDGATWTENETVQILDCGWEFEKISLSSSRLEVGQKLELSADISWISDELNPDNLEYKFVWQKNNWKDWGILQEFSNENTYTWVPKEAGEYALYIDVKDASGNKVSKNVKVSVGNAKWDYTKIKTSATSPQLVNKKIQLIPQIDGNKFGLQYKFVWQKNNWKNWGVIQDFSLNDSAVWSPKETGEYTIYVDVKSTDGNIVTHTVEFSIVEDTWKFESITLSPGGECELGKEIGISPQVSFVDAKNDSDSLQYKYVWMKNNWKDWGIIQDFSEASTCSWIAKSPGEYRIYVDVKAADGKIVSKTAILKVVQGSWKFSEVDVERTEKGVKILPKVAGNMYGLQYKYVWMKDKWSNWGVIQDFETLSVLEWETEETGKIFIYVDIRDNDGKIVSKWKEIELE